MKRRTDLLILLGFLIVSPMSLMGGCGNDDDDDNNMGPGDPFFVPGAWEGVWETTTVTRDCDGGDPDKDFSEDHLCEGDTFSFDDEGVSVECTGTGNDTSFDLTCSGSFSFEGCTVNVTVTISGTRNGDMYIADGHVEGTVTPPGCGGFENFCEDFEVTGTRTDDTPDCSSSRSFLESVAVRALERAQSE